MTMPDQSSNMYSGNVTESTWAEDVEDDIARTMEERGDTMPPLDELSEVVDDIEATYVDAPESKPSKPPIPIKKMKHPLRTGFGRGKGRTRSVPPILLEEPIEEREEGEGVDLAALMGELKNQSQKSQDSTTGVSLEQSGVSQNSDKPKKLSSDNRPEFKPASLSEREYQESFTSQQESAEIRHQMEVLDIKLMNVETVLNAIVAERANLPKHIDHLREETNKQLTIVLDRLHTALEMNTSNSIIQDSKNDIEVLSEETEHVLRQVGTDVRNDPSMTSATSNKMPITKKSRRTRLVE